MSLILDKSNVLLYGYGSKLELVYEFLSYFKKINMPLDIDDLFDNLTEEMFMYKKLDDINNEHPIYDGLVINCFNNDITLKFILNQLEELVFYKYSYLRNKNVKRDYKKVSCKNIFQQLDFFEKLYEDYRNDLFKEEENNHHILLILCNIDTIQFMNKFSQTFISQLGQIANIHLLCTADNLNVEYYWTQQMKDNLQFYFININTYMNYELEINKNYNLAEVSDAKGGEGLKEVFSSLNDNQR